MIRIQVKPKITCLNFEVIQNSSFLYIYLQRLAEQSPRLLMLPPDNTFINLINTCFIVLIK